MNFRRLLKELNKHDQDSKATWVELFFDLIFVVTTRVIGHELEKNSSILGILQFLVLITSTWWAWRGYTYYSDRFGRETIFERILTFVQIVAVGLMAVFAEGAFNGNFQGYALAYIVTRAVVISFYAYAAFGNKKARKFVKGSVAGYTLALLPWVLAIFASGPLRLALTFVGLAIDIGTPLLIYKFEKNVPVKTPHLKERFGLFVIILLGETFVSVVYSVINSGYDRSLFIPFVLSLAVVFCIWWVYFQNVEHTRLIGRWFINLIWGYSHLFFTVGALILSVGLGETLYLIADPNLQLKAVELTNVGVFLVIFSLIIIDIVTTFPGEGKIYERLNLIFKMLLSLLPLILVFFQPVPLANLVMIFMLMVLLVLVDSYLKNKQILYFINSNTTDTSGFDSKYEEW